MMCCDHVHLQASIMSRTHCPNIVLFVESGMAKSRDVYWIVMEFLQGDTLQKSLEDHGPMPEVEAIKVI